MAIFGAALHFLTAAALLAPSSLAASSGELARVPPWAQSPPGAVVEIFGLHDLMTGRQRLEAAVRDPRVARLAWSLDGRPVPGDGPFAVRLALGDVPAARQLVVTAYDGEGRPLYTLERTINPGGQAVVIDFRRPLAGSVVAGRTAVELCVRTPADDAVEEVVLERPGGALPLREAGPCGREGRVWAGEVDADAEMATLVARVVTRRRGALERAILLNAPGQRMDRVDVRLVQRLVRVADAAGRPVGGLEASDFRVLEDGVECPLFGVWSMADRASRPPLRIALLFDVSSSVHGPAYSLVEAETAAAFLERVFAPAKDLASVYAIATEPERWVDWTDDPAPLGEALRALTPRRDCATALYRTLGEALYAFQDGGGGDDALRARLIVLVSDGFDSAVPGGDADPTAESVLRYATASGVRVYPVAARRRLQLGLTKIDAAFLGRLASATGGLWDERSTLVLESPAGELPGASLEGARRDLAGWQATVAALAEGGGGETTLALADARRMLDRATQGLAAAVDEERRAEARAAASRAAAVEQAAEIWRRIEEDLAAQYLVAFQGCSSSSARRRVEISVRSAQGAYRPAEAWELAP